MKNILFLLFGSSLLFLTSTNSVLAIENPLDVPNNKFGVHILFPEEVEQAAFLVNANGGEWGYVTIPIQYSNRNLEKWQKFMDDCYKYKIIPIIRIATENYYFNTKVWRKPKEEDILDFANFLASLNWPTKNKYVVIFNEVNRSDEWGGTVNADEYARLLEYAIETFKSKSEDFFIISAGLDNAADGDSVYSMDQYSFITRVNIAVPGIFNKLDGLASHSYPNPGFMQPPFVYTKRSIASFRYERDLVKEISDNDLPIFITETGWSKELVNEEKIARYFEEAFASVWNTKYIVAVTPFLLRAGEGPFAKFSLVDTPSYKSIQNISKVKGEAILSNEYKAERETIAEKENVKTKNFAENLLNKNEKDTTIIIKEINAVKTILKWLIYP